MNKRTEKRRKLTPFERETERRRREMLKHLSGRALHVAPKSLKTRAWKDAPKQALAIMRARPRRQSP